MAKLHFISLGCPKNLVDSEVMLGHLAGAGYTLTGDPADAEIIIVNTCSFIEDAKKEAIDTILEVGEYKKRGVCRLLVVAGCLPQRYEGELAKLLPEVDIFIGAGEFPKIAEVIRCWEGPQEIHVAGSDYLYDHKTPRVHLTPAHVGYIKIAEGCSQPCSFCIVPRLRGPFRSRALESVVKEAHAMMDRGVREINLIAQDTTSYGQDVGADLTTLLKRIAALPGSRWIRILYAYPSALSDSLITAIRDIPDVCRYLDIPIQHISSRILKAMGRRGNGSDIRRLIERLRYRIPQISLRTSLIVGFPGETQSEFDELLDFVCEVRFDHLGAFAYSPEEGTKAAGLSGRIPSTIAKGRLHELMDLQREISLGNNMRRLGKKMEVLIESKSAGCKFPLVGRHRGQAPEVDGVVYISDGDAQTGQFVGVEITDAWEYDLIGKVAK